MTESLLIPPVITHWHTFSPADDDFKDNNLADDDVDDDGDDDGDDEGDDDEHMAHFQICLW